MKNSFVRIERIEINNFKNVKYGELGFENTRKPYKASILGLYGQNGSGKTALIDALSLLKHLLSGESIPEKYADYINVDADQANLKFEFKVTNSEKDTEYTALYEFGIRRDFEDLINVEHTGEHLKATKVVVCNEVLHFSSKSSNKSRKMQTIIDTRTDGVFVPSTKYQTPIGNDKALYTNLLVAKKIVSATSRSFIFSKELLTVLRGKCTDACTLSLIESLAIFGNFELFVIDTSKSGLITLNALPLNIKYDEKERTSVGTVMIRLNGTTMIPKQLLDIVINVIDKMNVVLMQLVPGLTINVKNLGEELLKDETVACKIQLTSKKNSKEIPLQYESEGIKKIISILYLLIVVYNNSSITVAIDEFDSGIFEYLLGELLRIISEKGKGQLIFTSHNFRPLETVDRGFIAFSTTNPNNRYIRLTNVKSNNNLRDFYYRDIVLGEQSETVYEPTNNSEISLAFREAGETSGS